MTSESAIVAKATSLEEWLRPHGLEENPFATWDAKEEREQEDWFEKRFIQPETRNFDDIYDLSSVVLCGVSGSGKTACRCRVEDFCRNSEKGLTGKKIFSVTHDNFFAITQKYSDDLDAIPSLVYVESILKNGLPKLFEYLCENRIPEEFLGILPRFRAFLDEFTNFEDSDYLAEVLRNCRPEEQQFLEKLKNEMIDFRLGGISSVLKRRLHTAIYNCISLKSHEEFMAIFRDERIIFCRSLIPGVPTVNNRVNVVIDVLFEEWNQRGENALWLFLYVLSDEFPNEPRSEELLELANLLEPILEKPTVFGEKILQGDPEYNSRTNFIAKLLVQEPNLLTSEIRAVALLKEFHNMVKLAGFDALFVLVDNIEKIPANRANPKDCVNLLSPFVCDLDIPGVYFKFFLPSSIQEELKNSNFLDSMIFISIIWSPERFKDILKARFEAATNEKRKTLPTLSAISDVSIKERVEEVLVKLSKTPRDLLKFGRRLLQIHVNNSPCKDHITADSLLDLLLDFILSHEDALR